MHPILASRTRLALYLLAWVPLAAGLALQLSRAGQMGVATSSISAAVLSLFYAVVCLSPWYSGRWLPLEPAEITSLLLNHTAAALVAATLFAGIARLLGAPLAQLGFLFGAAVLVYLLAVALHYVLFSFERSRDAEARAQEARVLAREAELKALKAQINPHFLFNSLNSISALATIDGQRAREMCLRLSDFLRTTLQLAELESIPIEEELALAKIYLDVERVRFGDRLRIEHFLGPGCEKCTVPALILQPLVENAVKHGIAGMLQGGEIRLFAECGAGLLRITLENDYEVEERAASNGVGLANVRNRLKARFRDRAQVTTESRDNRFCVTLELPCDS